MSANKEMLGHNNPPTEEEILQDKLNTSYVAEIEKIVELEKFLVPEIITDENAPSLADFLARGKSATKDIEAAHRKEKDGFLKLGRVVDAFKNGNLARISNATKKAEDAQFKFLTAKAEAERERLRLAKEKEEREAQELAEQARLHEAEGILDTAEELMDLAIEQEEKANRIGAYADKTKDSKLARVVSYTGAVSGLRTAWAGDIEDIGAVDLEKLRHYFKEEHIQTAINAFIKDGGRELIGVKIHEKSTLR